MIDFFVICAGVLLFWIIGMALLLLLGVEKRLLKTAPLMGAALVSLIAFVLYYCGVSIQMIQCLLLALSVAALIVVLYRRRDTMGQWRWLAGLLGLYTLLAVPLFIGGEQYYVFRGNAFDHFFYLSESLTVYYFPVRGIRMLPLAEAAQSFGTWVPTGQIGLLQDRPAVAVLFSTFLTPGFGDIIARAAMFNTAFNAMLWISVQYLWDKICGEGKPRRFGSAIRFLPPIAYVLGFFNQYSFDTNAWSQITSLPLLVLLFALYGERLHHVLQPEPADLCTGRRGISKASDAEWACLLLLASSNSALYLEGYSSYCIPLLFISVFCWLRWSHKKQSICRREAWLLPAVMIGAVLLVFLPNWKGSLGFLSSRVQGVPTSVSYADYFFRYWQGRTFTDSPRAVLNVIPSVLGFFYLTPDYEQATGSLGRNLFSGGMLLFNIVIIAGMIASSVRAARSKRFFSCYLTGTAWLTFGIFVLFCLTGQTWMAGKYLQYLSPCITLFLCLGLAGVGDDPSKKFHKVLLGASVILAVITVVSNIGFGVNRLACANESNGVGHVSTYPSILEWSSKTKYRWQVDLTPVQDCNTIEISTDSDHTDLHSNWLFFKVLYNNQKPYTDAELTMNFWIDKSFGHMKKNPCDGYVRVEDADGDGVFETVAGVY